MELDGNGKGRVGGTYRRMGPLLIIRLGRFTEGTGAGVDVCCADGGDGGLAMGTSTSPRFTTAREDDSPVMASSSSSAFASAFNLIHVCE
jgi:hypothetical protein